MGGGVGAPLVGALWEGIRCEGHTRQGLGKIHAGGTTPGQARMPAPTGAGVRVWGKHGVAV